jgi:hypothetical protein
MSARKYSILLIVTVVTLIAVIKGVSLYTANPGTADAADQTQTLKAQLSSAQQKLESATAGVVAAMGQLDELGSSPVAAQSPPAAGGLLGSILYSNRHSSVVIDGAILHEGDIIHGVKVFKIREDTVELEKNGQRWQQNVGMTFPPATDPV